MINSIVLRSLIKRAIKSDTVMRLTASLLDSQRQYQRSLNDSALRRSLQHVGDGVVFNGEVQVTHPGSTIIENNVHIGNNAYLFSRGGLFVGENTHISRNLVLYTANHETQGGRLPFDESYVERPVHIGRNVWIGMNVCICPGSVIEEGAIIGMGAVVSGRVPAGSTYVGGPGRIVAQRDEGHYRYLVSNKSYGGVGGVPVEISSAGLRPLSEAAKPPVFVLSAGRSGSHSIAKMLDAHPAIESRHEPRGQMVRLSTELAFGQVSPDEALQHLELVFGASTVADVMVHVESDQKYFNLARLLRRAVPHCKFIFLIRDGRDFVSSAVHRGWFSEADTAGLVFAPRWSQYRLQADRCGEMSAAEWDHLDAFGRCCWYWSYVNKSIHEFLQELDEADWLLIETDKMHGASNRIHDFVGAAPFAGEYIVTNQSRNGKPTGHRQWDECQRRVFAEACGPLMDLYFDHWRDEAVPGDQQ